MKKTNDMCMSINHHFAATYAFSLRRNSPFSDSTTALIDATTSHRLSYSELIHRNENESTRFPCDSIRCGNNSILIELHGDGEGYHVYTL